jgi:hypothetical protein
MLPLAASPFSLASEARHFVDSDPRQFSELSGD